MRVHTHTYTHTHTHQCIHTHALTLHLKFCHYSISVYLPHCSILKTTKCTSFYKADDWTMYKQDDCVAMLTETIWCCSSFCLTTVVNSESCVTLSDMVDFEVFNSISSLDLWASKADIWEEKRKEKTSITMPVSVSIYIVYICKSICDTNLDINMK